MVESEPLNPNEDWTAEDHEGIHLPIAITTSILILPISRAQALRWLNNSEWGAEASGKVMATIHVPEQSDVKSWERTHRISVKRNGEMTDIRRYEWRRE
jgi:hypothetical protein